MFFLSALQITGGGQRSPPEFMSTVRQWNTGRKKRNLLSSVVREGLAGLKTEVHRMWAMDKGARQGQCPETAGSADRWSATGLPC